ncbi:hypothetical protein lerEdw1_017886 [Lerista edwardsae]|nr:hypothetical protein lerEdw1_017886 [Lerista edwardsae]
MRRVAIKRRNDSNLIVCGAPAKKPPNPPRHNVIKLPRPPDPNDSAPSPSLLKALEAVVEAGRRGLLGPAAKVAATAAKPNWNGGNSNIVVCQEAQNPIPLVAGQTKTEKKTETINKEYGTVIPLVPSVEDFYPITNCSRGYLHTVDYSNLTQNFVSAAVVYILFNILIEIFLSQSRAFADTTLVWSSLLPRRFWKEDQAPAVMEKALKFVNSKMAKYCSEIGTYFLSHDLITSDRSSLFLPDSNDLSDEGNDIFIGDLAKVLKFILDVKG